MGRVTLLVSIIVIALAGCPGDVLRDLANPGEFALYGLSDGMNPEIVRFDQGATLLIGSAGSSDEKELTIRNLAEKGVLQLTGSPRVAFAGAMAAKMSVGQPPAGSIDPEDETSFTVKYAGGSTGQTSQMIIETNDPDQEEFVVTFQGQ